MCHYFFNIFVKIATICFIIHKYIHTLVHIQMQQYQKTQSNYNMWSIQFTITIITCVLHFLYDKESNFIILLYIIFPLQTNKMYSYENKEVSLYIISNLALLYFIIIKYDNINIIGGIYIRKCFWYVQLIFRKCLQF